MSSNLNQIVIYELWNHQINAFTSFMYDVRFVDTFSNNIDTVIEDETKSMGSR